MGLTGGLVRVAETILPGLPAGLDPLIGAVGGTTAYLLSSGARRAVRANLAVIAPHAGGDGLTRSVFAWQLRHYLELFRLAHMSHATIERTVDVVGWEHFRAALDEGKGVIITSGHLGSVSACGQIVIARGIPVTLPVERDASPFGQAVNRARAAVVLHVVPTDAALGMHRILKKGGVLGIIADRAVTGVGVRVPFFGREALLPSAAIVLALRTGAAVVPAFAERHHGRLTTRFEPALEIPRTGDQDADVREGVRRFAEALAARIRLNPAEWSVFEPMWEGR